MSHEGQSTLFYVLAEDCNRRLKNAAPLDANTYHITDDVIRGQPAMPPDIELKANLPDEVWQKYQKTGRVSIPDLMACRYSNLDEYDGDFAISMPCHRRWIIVAKAGTLGDAITRHHPQLRQNDEDAPLEAGREWTPHELITPSDKGKRWAPFSMNLKFALVIIDEAQLMGAPSAVQWKAVSSLEGNPAIICLSATPSATMAATSRYFWAFEQQERSKYMKYMDYMNAKTDDLLPVRRRVYARQCIMWKPSLHSKDRDFVAEHCWGKVAAEAKLGDKWVDDNSFDKRRELGERAMYPQDHARAMERIGDFLYPFIIQWSKDMRRGFGDDPHVAIPAQAKPPHAVYKVEFDFTKDTAEMQSEQYACDCKQLSRYPDPDEPKKQFTQCASEMDVYSVIPEILDYGESRSIRRDWRRSPDRRHQGCTSRRTIRQPVHESVPPHTTRRIISAR